MTLPRARRTLLAAAPAWLKHLTVRLLPGPVVRRLRQSYYAHLTRRFREEYEPDLAYLKYLLRPGDTVIDVGASIGIHTKILSRCVGESGHVLSVEPLPETLALLATAVKKLHLDNVRPLQCAISDRERPVTMVVPSWNARAENLWEASVTEDSASSAGRCVTVPARSIDSILTDLPTPPVLIKVDVEGHEWPCVRGAKRTLERHHPAWLIEVADPDDSAGAGYSLFAFLREHGYRAWRSAGATLVPRQPGEQSLNYWFLRPEHLARIKDGGLDVSDPTDR